MQLIFKFYFSVLQKFGIKPSINYYQVSLRFCSTACVSWGHWQDPVFCRLHVGFEVTQHKPSRHGFSLDCVCVHMSIHWSARALAWRHRYRLLRTSARGGARPLQASARGGARVWKGHSSSARYLSCELCDRGNNIPSSALDCLVSVCRRDVLLTASILPGLTGELADGHCPRPADSVSGNLAAVSAGLCSLS